MSENFMEPWEYKFAELIIENCMDIIVECDENPKMIVHEPYRTIVNNIQDYFYDDGLFDE